MLSSHQPSLKPHIHGLRSTVPIASPLAFRRRIRATQKPNLPKPVVRAVIGEDRDVGISASPSTDVDGSVSIVPLKTQSEVRLRAVITVKRKMKEKLLEKVEEEWEGFMTGIGRGILVQIVSEDVDPETKSGKRTEESPVRGWLQKPSNQPHVVEYAVDFNVSSGFGRPGAVLITNLHHKEFYLMEIVVHGFIDGPVFFPANSWIHSHNDNPKSRIIFNNHAYLSSQTPEGLKDLREEELVELRGDGKGERKRFERIYDYAPYNDLGNPDTDEDLARPVLAGEERPYPRRCRTGRPPTQTDSSSETRIEKPHPVYVPRDENFEELKQAEFSASALRALLHNLVPSLIAALSHTDGQFTCFSEIDKLYNDGVDLKLREDSFFGDLLVTKLFKKLNSMSSQMMKYNIPSIISRDRFAWLRDNEFSRQALAGVNPVNIERLKEFPITSKLDPAIYGPPESAITREVLENQLNGMTIEQAIEEKRLFILDYHDMLLPFIKKMKSLKDKKAYASRTIFFFDKNEILRPLVIELSLPPTTSSPEKKYIYTHGHDATTHWTWRMAKAHVCVNDTGVHQLVNHWLRTHACMEPYIIAMHRQLSALHPIYKLLHPHMRYTMEINAVARQSLINGGGIIESCFSPGKYSLEISSAAYKSSWRFDMEALPADLIRRGMAVEDPSQPCGVRLVIEDYPYAADGLLVWSAIEDWVTAFVTRFYPDSDTVATDTELHSWWSEIQKLGHPDKANEPWWPKLDTPADLAHILTIMVWTASGMHAAINFGQYPFGGYMPNRPTLMKKLIPKEDDNNYEAFMMNPQLFFLSSLPSQLQATKIMAVQDTLSTHSPDEEYLGKVHVVHYHWTDDAEVLKAYKEFSRRLDEIEETIVERNKDARLKNRRGAGVPPYELLLPSSGPGVTGRGIPNSISI